MWCHTYLLYLLIICWDSMKQHFHEKKPHEDNMKNISLPPENANLSKTLKIHSVDSRDFLLCEPQLFWEVHKSKSPAPGITQDMQLSFSIGSKRSTCSKALVGTFLALLCVHSSNRAFWAGFCKNQAQPTQCLGIYANSAKFPFVSLSSTRESKILLLLTNTFAIWLKQK